MSTYNTHNIRNIAFVGHAATGKTSLVEALLHRGGVIGQPGSVEKGNTVCDFEPDEKLHQHSLRSAVVSLDYNDCHMNLLDTPGYPDFIGQTLSVLPAADALAVVISAQAGIEFMTRRYMDWAAKHGYCRFIIINKIEGAIARLPALLSEIQECFGKECLPINLPTHDGQGVLDNFFNDKGKTAFSSVEEMHARIVDQVVEVDEQLMARFLEQGEVSSTELHEPFEKALREGHVIPVCFTSAQQGIGIKELLDIFVQLMPNPLEGTPHPFIDGGNEKSAMIRPSLAPDEHVIAHVFKVTHDPFVGKLALFRIHQGTITGSTQLFVGEQRKAFKVGHLFRVHGKDHMEVPQGIPGDICAIAKVDEVTFNAILHNSHDEDQVHALPADFPSPMLGVAITTQKHGDEQKLAEALEKIGAQDPCLAVEHDSQAQETILRGMGELHLRVVIELLRERYHLNVDTHPPAIAYRETITAAAEGHYRHKKQSGGAGQFGEVSLRVEPLPRGAGFEFVNKIVGGAVPAQFIPAVEKGVRQALKDGVLAGFPLQDIRVSLQDGKYHSVDSNEISFVSAGRKAFLEAVASAKPIVLEPIMDVEITTPQAHMGDISGDLASRRGQISATRSGGDTLRISAKAPLAELQGYPSQLKSLTGGEGTFTMELGEYQPTPPNMQKKLVDEYRKKHGTTN